MAIKSDKEKNSTGKTIFSNQGAAVKESSSKSIQPLEDDDDDDYDNVDEKDDREKAEEEDDWNSDFEEPDVIQPKTKKGSKNKNTAEDENEFEDEVKDRKLFNDSDTGFDDDADDF